MGQMGWKWSYNTMNVHYDGRYQKVLNASKWKQTKKMETENKIQTKNCVENLGTKKEACKIKETMPFNIMHHNIIIWWRWIIISTNSQPSQCARCCSISNASRHTIYSMTLLMMQKCSIYCCRAGMNRCRWCNSGIRSWIQEWCCFQSINAFTSKHDGGGEISLKYVNLI